MWHTFVYNYVHEMGLCQSRNECYPYIADFNKQDQGNLLQSYTIKRLSNFSQIRDLVPGTKLNTE